MAAYFPMRANTLTVRERRFRLLLRCRWYICRNASTRIASVAIPLKSWKLGGTPNRALSSGMVTRWKVVCSTYQAG